MRFLIKYIYGISEINNGTSFISFSGIFNNFKIQIKDSFKLIPERLSKMPKMFLNNDELKEIKKEIMPYDIYNENNIMNKFIDVNEVLKYISNDDKDEFLKNCKNWGCLVNNTIDIIKYSKIYCYMDVKILKKCYNVFRDWCLNDVNLDINNILTLPSMADSYLKNSGCYDGCYKISGIPQLFINECVVGGRTMSARNEKYNNCDKNEIINDFDGVSLYPSSMVRIKGFLKGCPKVIENLNYDNIKNYDGFFVQIRILEVGIIRDFPLMSYKDNKTGVRNFNNDMINKIMYVDKTSLEDLIEFQKIKFEILRGYYFDEGFNNKINDVMNYLFNKRKELKKIGNKSEQLYKLIMNAAYGKTLTKPHDKTIKFFNNKDDLEKYISRNYNYINYYIEYAENKFKLEEKISKAGQFNSCHLGCEILSMSKRIMNEVMCLAEDNNIKIYYQDTDSMHLPDKDIELLSNEFKKKYNRELIGKNLGQFHSDFNFEVKKNGVKVDLKNIVSTELIVLGKKCYIDKLRGEDIEGNYYFDYHIRLKGVNKDGIDFLLNNCKVDNKLIYNDYMEIYKDLYNDKKIEFDLTAGGNKACFQFDNRYNISTKEEFKRLLYFGKR